MRNLGLLILPLVMNVPEKVIFLSLHVWMYEIHILIQKRLTEESKYTRAVQVCCIGCLQDLKHADDKIIMPLYRSRVNAVSSLKSMCQFLNFLSIE